MAQSLKQMQDNCSTYDKGQLKSLYNGICANINQNNGDISLAREKKLWLEEKYPWLYKKEEEIVPDIKEVPYEVQLAKKYNQLWVSANKRGKDFNLQLKDVHHLLQQKECYYTGEVFGEGDLKRTIDRVDNNKGYVKGNVVACTFLANQMKEQIFERPTQEYGKNIEFIAKVSQKIIEHLGGDK